MDWDPSFWVCKATQLVPQAEAPRVDHAGSQVVECVEIVADSGEPELVQGLLAELNHPASRREGLLPSVQLGSLHALKFQLSV
ncbi:unnamed protein product [Prunus armeniaca]